MKVSIRSWLLLILLACIWGGSFILMKRGMETTTGESIFSDMQVAALRMGIAGLVMLPFGLFALKKIKTAKQVISLLVVGSCGNFIPAFLFTFAETELSSGLAGMLNSFTPFFTLIIGALFFKQALKIDQVIGLIIAFIGISLLVSVGSQSSSNGTYIHIGGIVIATILYGLSLNTIKSTLSNFKSWEITALAFTFVAIPAWVMIVITGVFGTISTNPFAYEGLGYIAILSIVGTCLALVIFNRIIALTSAVFASSVTYFIPIVAVFFGITFNRETFQWSQLLAMVVVLSGVFIANRVKKP